MPKPKSPKSAKSAPIKAQSKFKPRVEKMEPAGGDSDFTTIKRKKPFLG